MRTVQLEEVAEFINGRAFKPSEWGQSGAPIIRIQNLTGTNEAFNYYDGPIDERVRVRKGDILISWSASLGVYRWNGEDAVLNQHIFKVRLNDGIDKDYFYYAATNVVQEMASRVHGSTMQHITKDRFDSIHIPLPDLSEQKQIAGLLKQTDRLRRTRRYALELNDTFLPKAFLQLFGELRQNEHNWPLAELEANAEIVSGVAKGQKHVGRETVEVPYLRVANVQDGYLDLSEIKTIQALPADVESLRLKAGDIVMTEGGDFDKLGRGAIWPGGIADCIHQNHIFRVRLDSTKLLSTFFAAFLRSAFAKDYFLRCSKQTTNLASINMTQLRATPVPLPPLAKQKRFAALVARHERLRARQREALRQADHLFQSLLHRAFATAES